jgi:hypothetical protein
MTEIGRGSAAYVFRPSSSTSIADIALHCRKLPLGADFVEKVSACDG